MILSPLWFGKEQLDLIRIQWSQDFVPNSYYSNNNPNGFERVHYTFTTLPNILTQSQVSPGYNQGYGQHIWGMQLEEGSTLVDTYTVFKYWSRTCRTARIF